MGAASYHSHPFQNDWDELELVEYARHGNMPDRRRSIGRRSGLLNLSAKSITLKVLIR